MPKKIAIMQPYFFPYIGYWQLMAGVDELIVYDNVQFTKKGWVNRNRFLRNGKAVFFSLPLKKGSSLLDVKGRYLSDSFDQDALTILRQIEGAYKKAPNFNEGFSLFEECLKFKDKNLFNFIYHSIIKIKDYLGINTKIIISSGISCSHSLNSSDRVKAICQAQNASIYINPIGGLKLYSKEEFLTSDIELKFHKSTEMKYKQFKNESEFEAWLSILDLIMFNSSSEIARGGYLNKYDLV